MKMECVWRSPDGRLQFKLEGALNEIYEQVGILQEMFEFRNKCIDPDSKKVYDKVHYKTRKAGKNGKFTYYEMVCMEGPGKWRRLPVSLHDNDKGTMYPNPIKDDDGNYLGWYGWALWDKDKEAYV